MRNSTELAVYNRIAQDIAMRIVRGELKENTRISGRSLMAGEYQVSPETIRRSLNLLAEKGIVAVTQGSGAMVISRDKAASFIQKSDIMNDYSQLRKELKELRQKRAEIDNRISEVLDELMDLSERFRNTNPMFTVEYELKENSHIVGKSIYETKFYQNTGATIVAIKREGKIILSPGPDAKFCAGDTIVIACSTEILKRVEEFIGQS